MKKKHALVIALAFMIVGMMIFSVDSPPLLQNVESVQETIVPQEVVTPTAGEENADPLKVNVLENHRFEDWDVDRPEAYNDAYASEYRHVDFTYHGAGTTGTYAAKVEVEGTSYATAGNYIYQDWTVSGDTLIEPGITLTFNWNTLANPDMGSNGYIYVEVNTLGSTAANLYYVISHGTWGLANGSIDKYILMNDTLNQWNGFDRNITEDFQEAYGSVSSIQYINRIWFRSYSPIDATGTMEIAYDNIVLSNGTYSGWIQNGNFETGVSTPWAYANNPRGYIEQSLDSPDATHSLNLSIPVNTYGGTGDAYVYKSYSHPGSFFASEPEMFIIDFDWKYSDVAGLGSMQYANIQFCFTNTSGYYYLNFYIGTHTDQSYFSNSSTQFHYMVPEAGARDSWQHSTLDLYEYMTAVGLQDVALSYHIIYARNARTGASVTLLVDNLQFITYPTGDPGFEQDWYSSVMTPFAGWAQWNGETGVISRSTDAFIGNYACNLTVANGDSAGVSRYLYHPLNPSDLTNFTWRLDEIGDINSYAHIEIEFSNGNALIYVLGAGPSYIKTNSSNIHRIIPSSYNEVGTWNHLVVNLTVHVTEAFGYWSGVYINRMKLTVFAPAGQRVSILYDDLQFIDGAPPVVDSVSLLPSAPMYYDYVQVNIYAHDDRTGIQTIFVDYNNGTGWFGLPVTDMVTFYAAVIPAHAYGAFIQFQISLTDNGGVGVIDNNGGAMYSYTVGDDIGPSVSIDALTHMEEVEGVLAVDVTADDVGSGMDYVEFYLGAQLISTDLAAPWSVPFDFNNEDLGVHVIGVNAYDVAGNMESDSVPVTVVDTLNPQIDSPTNVTFDEGETGYSIEWTPSDARPASYQIIIDGSVQRSGLWNSSAETISVSLDGLGDGEYNYTCAVFDEAGLINYDTVWVTVNDVATTTTTTTTTTTDTTTTDTTTTGTTGTSTTGGGDTTTMMLILGIGGAAVVLVVIILFLKRPKS